MRRIVYVRIVMRGWGWRLNRDVSSELLSMGELDYDMVVGNYTRHKSTTLVL